MEKNPLTDCGKPLVGSVSDNRPSAFDQVLENLHETASDVNKSKCQWFSNIAIAA